MGASLTPFLTYGALPGLSSAWRCPPSCRFSGSVSSTRKATSPFLYFHTCWLYLKRNGPRLVDETVKALGGVDTVVNNAATAAKFGPIVRTDAKTWDLVMRGQSRGSLHPLEAMQTEHDRAPRGCYPPPHVKRGYPFELWNWLLLSEHRGSAHNCTGLCEGMGT